MVKMRTDVETSFGHKIKQTGIETDPILYSDGKSKDNNNSDAAPNISLRRRKTVVCLCALTIMLEGVNISLPGPFFPDEAEKKGLSKTQIGFVVGSLDIANLTFSFVIASLLSSKNIKFFYSTGLLWSSVTAACFGLIGEGPSGTTFFVSGISIRIVNGLGASMLYSTCLPIAAQMFPEKAGIITTIIQISLGSGFLVGPPVGSILVPFGGYKTPFLFVSAIEFITFLIGIFIVPAKGPKTKAKISHSDYLKFLFQPSTLSVILISITAMAASGVRDTAYALYFEESLGMSTEFVGYIFIASSVGYLMTGPIVGVLVEMGFGSFVSIFCHSSLTCFIFLFYLPSLVPKLESVPWALAILFSNGITMAAIMNPSFLILEKVAIKQGKTDMQQIKTMVASCWNLSVATGRCVGSFLVGGFINDTFGFYNMCLYYSIALAVTSTWNILFLIKNRWIRRIHYGFPAADYSDGGYENDKLECDDGVRESRTVSRLFLSSMHRSNNLKAM